MAMISHTQMATQRILNFEDKLEYQSHKTDTYFYIKLKLYKFFQTI